MILPLLLLSSPPLFAQDWPELRGPDQDGAVRRVSVYSEPFELRTAWSQALGSGYSGVAVADGVVVGTFSDGTDDHVVALDVETGAELWRFRFGPTYRGQQGSEDGPTSTPCIFEGKVFAPGPRGNLVALDLKSGERLWSIDLAQRFGAQFHVYGFGSSPLIVGDVLYQPLGTRSGLAGVGLDPSTGKLRWKHEAGWVDYQNSLRFHEEDLLLAVDAADLSLVDSTSGETLLRLQHTPRRAYLAYPQVVPVPPLDDDRFLFVNENETALRHFDAAQEQLTVLWRSPEIKQCYAPPVIHGGAIYGLSGTFLVCVDLETGKRIWKSREPGARGLMLVGGHLVLFSSEGDLVVAEATRAGFVETTRLKVAQRGGYTPPCFAAGRLFARNTEGLTCVEILPRSEASVVQATPEAIPLPPSLEQLVARIAEGADARSECASWWEGHEIPLVEGERVHFLYRGAAQDVAIVGDMVRDRSRPHTMSRVPGTDFFHRSYPLEPGGLWQYYFLVDYEDAVLDPRNPQQRPALSAIHGNPQSLGYEPPSSESLWAMPGWEAAAFLDGIGEEGGRIETLPYESQILRATRDLIVYLPAAFEDSPGLPVLYVLGGDSWFDHGELKPALDALMGERCAPAVVVGLPFHVGSSDRMGGYEYARAILVEIAPLIAERFGTGSTAVAFGASDDATGVLALAALAQEGYPRLAVFSAAADPEDFALLERTERAPEAIYIEWSQYEGRLPDENSDYRQAGHRLVELFEARDCEVLGGEVLPGPGFASWSARLDRVLAFLLPLE